MRKLLITMAGLMTKGRCDTRYCGKALEEAKVVEMMPSFLASTKEFALDKDL